MALVDMMVNQENMVLMDQKEMMVIPVILALVEEKGNVIILLEILVPQENGERKERR